MGQERSRSSIGAGLDVVADQWTLLILRELFAGVETWKGLSESLAISPATLKRRLTQLIDVGCLERQQQPGRKLVRYLLTPPGLDLFPFMMAAREWQMRWDARPEAKVSRWYHSCGEPLRCAAYCQSCDGRLINAEVGLVEQDTQIIKFSSKARRYRGVSAETAVNSPVRNPERPLIVDVLGDSRTTVVMAALLRGIYKFDAIQQFTGLPPATISSRLRRIQLLGLGHARLYQESPDRMLYEPSKSGRDLLGLALQLMQWGNRWLVGSTHLATQAIHQTCGQQLGSVMRCQHCHGVVSLDQVVHKS